MASMNVSVPDPMRDWVEQRIGSGQYASVSDYVRDLIRRDQAQAEAHQALVAALIEGEGRSRAKERGLHMGLPRSLTPSLPGRCRSETSIWARANLDRQVRQHFDVTQPLAIKIRVARMRGLDADNGAQMAGAQAP
jgi:antitoxin ParD1/3/4